MTDRVRASVYSAVGMATHQAAVFPTRPSQYRQTIYLLSPRLHLSAGDSSTYYSFPKDLRTPRTYEWHFGIDQSLGRIQQLSVAYVGGAGRDLIYWHTYDVGLPLVQAYSNDARSDYHALLVEYVRRRSRGFQGSVWYTLSHALDNDSGEASRGYAPPQLISPSLNWGSADFDRRHVLRMVGSYPGACFAVAQVASGGCARIGRSTPS